jgi:hypothetical protein
VSLVRVVGGLWRVLAVGGGGLVCPLLCVVRGIVAGVLLLLLCVVVMLEVTVVHLAFPPAAVYHASKMHCHVEVRSRVTTESLRNEM